MVSPEVPPRLFDRFIGWCCWHAWGRRRAQRFTASLDIGWCREEYARMAKRGKRR